MMIYNHPERAVTTVGKEVLCVNSLKEMMTARMTR